MSEPMVQVPKSWLTNREKCRRNRDSWKRQAQEWEAVARVLAEALGECPVMDCPADRIAPDGKGVCPGGDQDAKCWLTWARVQVQRQDSLSQSHEMSTKDNNLGHYAQSQNEPSHLHGEQVKP